MCAKGRVKSVQASQRMPSLLEQPLRCLYGFDERMRPRTLRVLESGAFEALPVTCSNTLTAFAVQSDKFDCYEYVRRKPACVPPVLRNAVSVHCTRK